MDNSDKQEFTDDLLISCKMGKRSYANRKPKDTESQDLPHDIHTNESIFTIKDIIFGTIFPTNKIGDVES